MSFGIIEVITLLMGLSGFSVQQNPKPPTAEQALEYAVPDADIVAHFDAVSVIPGNYKVLANLQNQPQIKASPELAKLVRKTVAEIDGPRGLVKNLVGVDLTTDVADATAFLRVIPQQQPTFVVAVHGKFKADTIDKIGKLTGKASVKEAGGAWVDAGDGNAVALTRSGVLLAGTSALVKERIATTWQKPALTSGTNLGNVAELINAKPVFAVVMMLSPGARTELLGKHQGQNFLTDIIKRHKLASFAIFRDGIGWSWIDSNKAGLDAMAQISDGMVDVLRAAQIAPRGFAKITMGALESYRGQNKQVDELIAHKADIWKLVDAYSGDGNFKTQVDKDAAKLKLTVRLSGKSLSEVLPAGGIIPMMAIGWLTAAQEVAPAQPVQIAVPPAPTSAPSGKAGKTTPPVKSGGTPKRP
ncbi:MAG TPA: hypothetical protein VL326_07540 [Kofleriaceae bacterium]|nr:hypothetical protein [Kofleriaceae bacterium]